MTWQQAGYDEVKNEMRPGDVLAFGGTYHYSEMSKAMTRSEISHIALVLESSPIPDETPSTRSDPQIIEASKEGIVVRWLDEHISGYPGNIWWCPLSDYSRSKLDVAKLKAFLLEQVGVPFDLSQAIQSALDKTDHVPLVGGLTHSEEDFSDLFCSEMATAALEVGGVIESLNCSEVTPPDLFRFAIYQATYHQIKGSKTVVKGFNTLDPEGWGE